MSPLVRAALIDRAYAGNVLPIDPGADLASRCADPYDKRRGRARLRAERDAIAADPVDSLKAEAGAW